jgi:membrane-associated phospholipid phosphatase
MNLANFKDFISFKDFRPSEKLTIFSIAFFSFLIIIDYFLHKNKSIYLLPLNLLIIILFLLIPYWRNKALSSSLTFFFLSVFPLTGYAYLYKLAGSLIHLLPSSWKDDHLARIDRLIFGHSPNLTLISFYSPWFTELMMFAYVFYLPLVVILAFWLYKRKGAEKLESYILSLGLAYVICFIVFILFPAASPRFFYSGNQPASGFLFWKLMKMVEAHGQYQGGSFPSAHCAAGSVMIVYAWQTGRWAFILIFPLIILFFISTIYGQYHYAVDVLAGIIVGVLSCITAERILSNPSKKVSA